MYVSPFPYFVHKEKKKKKKTLANNKNLLINLQFYSFI